MFVLTMATFGAYTIISIFLLFWIPGFIPLESIFLIPAVFLILLPWWGIRSVRFYNRLNRELFTGWLMPHYAFNAFLVLLVFAWIIVMLRLRDSDFPEYWGQLLGAVLIVYFFGILPIPAAFKKSRKAGMYAVACLVCVTLGFLLLFLAWKILYYNLSSAFIIIEEMYEHGEIMVTDVNRWFSLFGQKVPFTWLHFGWLTGLGLLLLLAAYLLYAKMLSELTGDSLRKMFPKPVLCLIGSTATCHLLFFLLMGIAAIQGESGRRKIQDRFGRYPSAEGMNELYFAGQKPDKAFWDYFCMGRFLDDNGISKPPEEKEVVLDEIITHRFSELTGEEKRIFSDTITKLSSSLMKLDNRLKNGIPKFPLEMKTDKMLATQIPHLNSMRVFCYQTKWRTYMALEAENKQEAFRILEITRKMARYGEGEAFIIGAFVDITCYNIYLDTLEQLVEKHMLTRELIQMISQELLALEKRIPQMEKSSLYSEAVCGNDVFRAVLSGQLQMMRDENTLIIPIRSLPFFLPQFQWLLLQNQVSLLRFYDAENLEAIPDVRKEKRTPSNWVAYLFTPSLRSAYIKFRGLIARSRAERVILACELFRMDTGKYPASASELVPKYLDSIPEDPFTGKPLLFRAGKIRVEVWKIAEKDKIVRVVGEPKEIEGIQVWSVGPNGKNDDGIYNNQKNQNDIRAVIQTR
ncbi:MAG: hypothetical protein BWY31_00281 [Lentisphaerae bacterium ADurb.Bin242]|nr:MAG: hypothetical protein BWY31_00281 [Lentisphaerae bacterium ADurb.Bin242]